MSYAVAASAMIAHFDDLWGDETEVAWPNVKFKSEDHSEYVEFRIHKAPDTQITTGNSTNDWRKFGLLVVRVFTELSTGGKRSDELIDTITNAYRGLQLDPAITFGEIDIVSVGELDGFFQENVEIQFYRDEQH